MHGVIREKKTGRERGRQADKGMRRTSQRLPRATTTIHGDGRRWDGTDLPHRQTGGDTPHATAPWNGRNKSNPARARTRRPTPKPESFISLPPDLFCSSPFQFSCGFKPPTPPTNSPLRRGLATSTTYRGGGADELSPPTTTSPRTSTPPASSRIFCFA
jgi:hypothetical protein